MPLRYSDRRGWWRLDKTRFQTLRLDNDHFTGVVTLLCLDEFKEPFYAEYDPDLCVAASGYTWVQHFPDDKRYVQTAAFDGDGQVVQWYIDLCGGWGVGEDGVPWYEDLYLDIVARPSGKLLVLDADELEKARAGGEVTDEGYREVRHEAARLLRLLRQYEFTLIAQSRTHRDLLLEALEG